MLKQTHDGPDYRDVSCLSLICDGDKYLREMSRREIHFGRENPGTMWWSSGSTKAAPGPGCRKSSTGAHTQTFGQSALYGALLSSAHGSAMMEAHQRYDAVTPTHSAGSLFLLRAWSLIAECIAHPSMSRSSLGLCSASQSDVQYVVEDSKNRPGIAEP